MTMLSNDEIEKIRSQVNIEDIIREYGDIQRFESVGKDYRCICPFHDDHSPSMRISTSKQIFKCFVCGVGGNVFTFVQKKENISFVEAVQKIADKIGYHLNSNVKIAKKDKLKKEHDIMNIVEMFYQNNLNTSSGIEAKKYLAKRKIDENIIKEFGIGLANDNLNDIYQLLDKKGYDQKTMETLGLINVAKESIYDFFTGRITFPINDTEGNIIAFSSRIYRGEEDVAKYINSKENVLYTKGDNLFNYFRAKGPAKQEKCAILVEGQMDAIRVYSSGIKNVVALMGTALTQNQINLLKKLQSKVILCLDGDEPGKQATIKNGDLLTEAKIPTQVIRLSDYKDPDEYILHKGIEAFKENLINPLDFIDFKMMVEKENVNVNNTEELAAYINKVISDISKESDPIIRNIALNKISEEYKIDLDTLKLKLDGLRKEEEVAKAVFSPSKNVNLQKKRYKKQDIAIRKILFYMMNDIKYIKIYQDKIGYFDNTIYRSIANEIVYFAIKNKSINVASFISYIEQNEELSKYTLELIDAIEDELDENLFLAYIDVLEQSKKEKKIKDLQKSMKSEMDFNKKQEMLREILEIKKGSVLNEKD